MVSPVILLLPAFVPVNVKMRDPEPVDAVFPLDPVKSMGPEPEESIVAPPVPTVKLRSVVTDPPV